MILSDNEVTTRLESPLNLINRIQKLSSHSSSNAMSVFGIHQNSDENSAVVSPRISDDSIKAILDSINENDNLDEVMPDNSDKIRLGIVKSKALEVMHNSLEMLGANLSQVSKVERLSTIARDMKSIIEDDDKAKAGNTNIVVYKPITNEITKYDTIVVGE